MYHQTNNESSDNHYAKSKYNAGLLKLDRLNSIKKAIIQFSIDNNYRAWFNAVERIRIDLHEHMNKEEILRCDDYEKRINIIFNQSTNSHNNDFLAKTFLKKYEMSLNELERKYGLSMPDKEDLDEPDEEWS